MVLSQLLFDSGVPQGSWGVQSSSLVAAGLSEPITLQTVQPPLRLFLAPARGRQRGYGATSARAGLGAPWVQRAPRPAEVELSKPGRSRLGTAPASLSPERFARLPEALTHTGRAASAPIAPWLGAPRVLPASRPVGNRAVRAWMSKLGAAPAAVCYGGHEKACPPSLGVPSLNPFL